MNELLFVCSAGKNRSPTDAAVFNELLAQDGLTDYHASYAGWLSATPPTEQQITEAYGIFACDGQIASAIQKTYPGAAVKLRSLQIPDVYQQDDPELAALFTEFYHTHEWKHAIRRQAACGRRTQTGP